MGSKAKKASGEQKEFLICFMENNIAFSQDKFEGVDGSHTRFEKWQELSNQLNDAVKDPQKWRKFWLDQRSQIKEKEALLKVSFERSGVNGPQRMKPLSDFEKRVLQLMVPALVTGNEKVVELFNIEESMVEEYLEDDCQRQIFSPSKNQGATEEAAVTAIDAPVATPAPVTAQLRKRK